jgi:glutaminyl-tRNA synthetase
VLRAKIDMASPNINLRDPTLYRIRKVAHQRTGDEWCIYPMYDYAHTLSDAIEGTTHSLCSLEFEDHRPLYDWFLDQLWKGPSRPRQIEFSRLNLMFTVMSKRILKRLVDEGRVDGWDDPRMPTLSGFRRRGYTPESIRQFVRRVGVTKKEKVAELGLLEGCIREDLNEHAPRRFAVLDPLRIVLENYPDQEEWLDAANHPNKPELGTRKIPFCKEILIEREDFMENAPSKFHRLKPGGEVRLRYGYIVKCERVVKNAAGEVTELRCTYDPATRSGSDDTGRKVKGTIHWVSAKHAVYGPVRLYDRLFVTPFPGDDLARELNPESLRLVERAALEPALADAEAGERFQFERQGYFAADSVLSKPGKPVFNRTVTLRDSWAKLEQEALAKLPAARE